MGNNQQVTFSNGDTWKEINLKANHNPTDKWEKAYIDFNIPLEIEEEVIMPAREGNLEGSLKNYSIIYVYRRREVHVNATF